MKKNIFLGIAFMAFLAACTDDLGENKVQNPVQVGDEILFGSTISGDADVIESRTVYGDRTDTGIPVYWKEEGDLVAIFCPQASQPANKLVNYLVKPQMGTDGKPTNGSASVTAQVNPGEAGLQWGNAETHRFYAFYPAKSVKGTEDDGKIKSNIPVEQNVAKWRMGSDINGVTTHFGLPNMDLAYMYAYNEVVTADMDKGTPIDLKFHNLLTVLDITIPGPETGSDPITVTAINVEAVSDDGQAGHEPILTGDFYCYLRPGQGHEVGYCEPVNPNPTEVSNRIAISTYNPDTKKFIEVGPDQQINVKAYILPHTGEVIEKQSLKISVVTMNGAPKTKTLQKRQIMPGMVNRVRLPHLEQSNETNYWMSNLDPNVYFTELSLPGSHQSVGDKDQWISIGVTYDKYQGNDLSTQFKDGIRAFSFQTTYRDDDKIRVFASGVEKDELYVYLNQLATELETAKLKGKSDFALVSIVFKSNGSYQNVDSWYEKLANALNSGGSYSNLPIYKGGITADTTIKELANQIVLRIDHQGETNIPGLISQHSSYGDPVTGLEGISEGKIPMYWGSTKSDPVLSMFGHDGTSIDVAGNNSGQINDMEQKMTYIRTVFSKSVDMYHNNAAHDYFYHTNIGGFYCINRILDDSKGGNTIDYTKEIMPRVVDELQRRGEDASLGVVLMNFADKQKGSGADYGCDGLIQTIIYNNFSFALRKAGGSTPAPSYNASYKSGGNAVGWDE